MTSYSFCSLWHRNQTLGTNEFTHLKLFPQNTRRSQKNILKQIFWSLIEDIDFSWYTYRVPFLIMASAPTTTARNNWCCNANDLTPTFMLLNHVRCLLFHFDFLCECAFPRYLCFLFFCDCLWMVIEPFFQLRSGKLCSVLMVCIWRHSSHVGVQNNALKLTLLLHKKNLWGHFLLFCTPTWTSYHLDANQDTLRMCSGKLTVSSENHLIFSFVMLATNLT